MKRFDLTILSTTDVHGQVFSKDYWARERTKNGLAKISTMVERIRKEKTNVLYFDNGDAIQGSPLEYHHAIFEPESIDPTIEALNFMKCDAMTIGNHEFNFGRKMLEKAIREARFPITSANIVDKETGRPKFGRGYTVFEFENGPTVAYLSLTTKFIPYWEEPNCIRDLDFLDPVQTARKFIKRLKLSCVDLIVIGYHGGLERDPESGKPIADLDGENQGYEMAMSLEDVDAFIFGHQHLSFATKLNGIPIVMASSSGKALGMIELHLVKTKSGWKTEESSVKLLSPDEVVGNREILAKLTPYDIKVEEWLDEVIGKSEGDFSVPNGMYARLHETALVNFINEVQIEYSDADISATSVFSTAIKGWKEGPLTRRDLMGVYIYSNTLKVFELTGQEIKDMVEHSATYLDFKDGEVVESGKMKGYKYNIFMGISYTIDLEKEPGKRIVRLEKDGKPLNLGAKYRIVVNSYQAGGSGGYTMFIGKKPVKEVNIQVAELLVNYVKKARTIKPHLIGNWKILQA